MSDDLLKPANRFQEIYAGIFVLAAALLLGYFGVRGAIMYLHGSRAAPADPVACGIGLLAGFGGGYAGVRLLLGWHGDQALLPTVFLFVGGAAALVGGLWFILINRALHGSILQDAQIGYWFGLIGITALVLGWRRVRKRPPESEGMPPT
jgi:hypothetical protein